MLDFGDDTHKVASDATRLVARMKRDWIDLGRRPAGICGACLIIAARMNNYRRSMAEIVHVVKVAETTVQQRLSDFSATATANLTVEDFSKVWLEKAENPPAYEKEKKKKKKKQKHTNGKKRKSHGADDLVSSEEEDEEEEEEELEEDEEAAVRTLAGLKGVGVDDDGFKKPYPILGLGTPPATQEASTRGQAGEGEGEESSTTSRPFQPGFPGVGLLTPDATQATKSSGIPQLSPDADAALEKSIQDEVSIMLESSDLQTIESEELRRRAESHRLNPPEVDESLADVDDDEIDSILLDDESVKIKTQVWMQNNLDYLADQEQKRLKADTDKKHGVRSQTKKKRRMKPRDSSAPGLPASPAESARLMLEERAFSKKINYAAMDKLFE